MNNASVRDEEITEGFDRTPALRRREGELVSIVEAIGRVGETDDWKLLKKLLWDSVEGLLERRVRTEASKQVVDPPELYRLQGQLAWARKYTDLDKLREAFKTELTGIRKQLKKP